MSQRGGGQKPFPLTFRGNTMHSFKDKNGTDWIIDLNLETIRFIESCNFGQALRKDDNYYIQMWPPQEDLFTEIITNPAVAFGMIWCCCREQAAERNIKSEEEFARLFNGQAAQDSRLALYEELPDFFPEMRTTLKALIDRYSRIHQIADQKLGKKATEMMSDEMLEKEVDKAIAKIQKDFEASLGEPSI